MNETIESDNHKRSQRTLKMSMYYKDEKQNFEQTKTDRKEAFDFMRARQGDNSQAVRQRNKQIMMKLQRS